MLGSPIAHSLSPVLHTAAYEALGLEHWEYTAERVSDEHFLAHVASLDPSWRGLSLTMPLKEVAFDAVQAASDVAVATGAVNTLRPPRRRGLGRRQHRRARHRRGARRVGGPAGRPRRARRLGSDRPVGGGRARRRSGCGTSTSWSAAQARPATLAQATEAGMTVSRRAMGDWPEHVDLVVSTVPSGGSAAAGTLPEGGRALLDVVYGGGSSPFAEAARARGYLVVPGTTMLLHQAAEQVRLMTGYAAPVEAMRAALDDALARRAEHAAHPVR